MNEKQAREFVKFEIENNERGQWPDFALRAEGYLEAIEKSQKMSDAVKNLLNGTGNVLQLRDQWKKWKKER